MRIISGIYKSRILKSPSTYKIRPTSDRAKETLFNILNNRIDFNGIKCMDLFCGSGNLGLECISRGASECIFVDEDVNLVRKNIETLGVGKFSNVIKSDVINFLDGIKEAKSDLIFCDPPYSYEKYDLLIDKVSNLESIFVLEHSEDLNISKCKENIFLKKKIGTVNFTFFDFSK